MEFPDVIDDLKIVNNKLYFIVGKTYFYEIDADVNFLNKDIIKHCIIRHEFGVLLGLHRPQLLTLPGGLWPEFKSIRYEKSINSN